VVSISIITSSLTLLGASADIAGGEIPDDPIPLPNVSARILEKVVEYCQHHHEHPTAPSDKADEKRTDDILPWDLDFCKVDQPTLFELILVRYLSLLLWAAHSLTHSLTHPLTHYTGRQLPRHQAAARSHVQDGCQHDQGQDPRGDPKDV